MTRARTDIIYGLVMIAIAALFVSDILTFPTTSGGLNPRIFPLIVTMSTGALSVVLIGQGLKKMIRQRGTRAQASTEAHLSRETVGLLVLLAIAGLVYTLTVERLGYIVATTLLVGVVMVLFKARRWYEIILVSVVTAVVFYHLFRTVFRVPLPRSIFW